jgi:MFS family permease
MLAAALTAQTTISVVEQGIPTLTGFIKQGLSLSAAAAGAVVASLTLGKVLGAFTAGKAVDRIGERTMIVIGGAGLCLFVVAASVSPLAGLVILLVCGGLFIATATPAGGKLILVSFPRRQRGFAMGIRQAGIPLGGLAAALILPPIAHAFGWRVSVAVTGVIAGLGALAVFLVAGVDSREERHATRASAVAAPWRALLHDRQVVLATLWALPLVGGQYAIVAFLALDVHERSSVSLPKAALLVAAAQVGGIVGRIGWGLTSDRLLGGRRRPIVIGINVVAIACALALALLPGRASLGALAVVAFVCGLSIIGWQGMWVTAMTELAGPARAGAVTGFGLTFINVSVMLAPPLYGFIADQTGSFRASWIVLGAMLALGLVPAVAMREPHAG